MRILAGFFSLVFLIVNPTMYFKVFGEIAKLVHKTEDSPFKPYLFQLVENATRAADIKHTYDITQLSIVSTLCLLHVMLSILHAYGCFTGRPAYIRPMVVNCFASTGLMLIYLMLTVFVVFNVSRPHSHTPADAMKFETNQKSNLTIGGVFFVIYILWDAITLYTYFDIKQLHEDFMYWIVEERNSQRKGSLRLSTDRSGGSSKSSKASKNSTKSSKMEEQQSRPNSAAASIPSKKTMFGEIAKLVHKTEDSPFKPYLFQLIENATWAADIKHTYNITQLSIVSTLCLLHVMLSILHAYGCFTGRPAYIRPMVVNCFASTGLMLIYLMLTVFVVFNVSRSHSHTPADAMKFETNQKSNLTIGGVFFVIYILWDAITLYTYFDIKQLHEDFMYWIVEERNSQRKGSLRLSTDRSGGSSKSSKASKNSSKSSKMEEQQSRPNSAAASIPSKKTSLANNRLSVPL